MSVFSAEKTIEESLLDWFAGCGPLAIFPNPMRSDGVFIAEDVPIAPYEGVRNLEGKEVFPAVPQNARTFPCQVTREMAGRVVLLHSQRIAAPDSTCGGLSEQVGA